jgi:hypothetical protein
MKGIPGVVDVVEIEDRVSGFRFEGLGFRVWDRADDRVFRVQV